MDDHPHIALRLTRLDTPTLSDALDRMGIKGQAIGIAPTAGPASLVGRAFTVRMLPAGTRGGSVGDYIDDVEPGYVVVIDNQGRLDQTVWGDILTLVASRTNIAGTVIDGVCRDTHRAAELVDAVLDAAEDIARAEDQIRARTADGAPLRQIRAEAGYHRLQTRQAQ